MGTRASGTVAPMSHEDSTPTETGNYVTWGFSLVVQWYATHWYSVRYAKLAIIRTGSHN